MQASTDGGSPVNRTSPEQTSTGQRQLRTVVVEDEFVVFLSLKDMLESLGCEVVANAQDAGSAVEVTRALRPDFVVMDLGLPGGNAVAATRAITAETEAQVIVVTAYGDAHARAVKEAGAACLLAKPVQEAQLAAAIAGLFGRVQERPG